MHDPENSPEKLVAVPNDLEAAIIVSALAAHDVDATTSGEYTSGFRAEAPGLVEVLVRRCDLSRARAVLNDLGAKSSSRAEAASSATSLATKQSPRATWLLAVAGLLIFVLIILQFFDYLAEWDFHSP